MAEPKAGMFRITAAIIILPEVIIIKSLIPFIRKKLGLKYNL